MGVTQLKPVGAMVPVKAFIGTLGRGPGFVSFHLEGKGKSLALQEEGGEI